MTVGYNINNYVWVKLTEDGYRHLVNERDKLVARNPRLQPYTVEGEKAKADEDGYRKFPLWEVMQIFGNRMAPGRPMPFDSQMRLKAAHIVR